MPKVFLEYDEICLNRRSSLWYLFVGMQQRTTPLAITASPDGRWVAALCDDGHLRLFRVHSGKLCRVYLETLQVIPQLLHKAAKHPSLQSPVCLCNQMLLWCAHKPRFICSSTRPPSVTHSAHNCMWRRLTSNSV